MKYILPLLFRFFGAFLYTILLLVMIVIVQIVYVIWTFKFKFFNEEWNGGDNIFEYDANTIFERDPKKIYPSMWHWAVEALPKKKVIEITNEPFLNKTK